MSFATAALVVLILLILPLLALAVLGAFTWRIILKIFKRQPGRLVSILSWKPLVIAAAIISGLFLVCLADAMFLEPAALTVERSTVPSDRPVLGRSPLKIVHLSDLHMEEMGERERFVLRQIEIEQPHVVLLTGDYVNRREALPDFIQWLKAIKATHGVYGVEGHADHKFDIHDAFTKAGAILLRDETWKIGGLRRDLVIAGLAMHPSRSLTDILESTPPDAYRLVLHHSPEQAVQLDSCKADLFLCGHTHGGQIRLPFLGPLLDAWKVDPDLRGVTTRSGAVVIVNRGVGMSGGPLPRLRFMSRPEIRIIEIAAP